MEVETNVGSRRPVSAVCRILKSNVPDRGFVSV